MSSKQIKIIPLGGVNEIGKNMMLYEYDNRILIVDCGVMFPDEETPGVDLIIPDFAYLRENADRIAGLVITHGHEDHVGAMGFLLTEFPDIPIYSTPLTLGIMGVRLRESPVNPKTINTHEVTPGDIVKIGPFEVEFIRVGHSIPDACGLAITTDAGTVIQSGDFKFDQMPVDHKLPQFSRFGHYGERGVLALLSDTTNAGRAGLTGSESSVRPGLERIFADAPGRIFVASFASNIHRVQQVLDVADLYGRRVAVTGRSMITITGIATDLGYLKPPKPILPIEQIDDYPDEEVTVLMTGTQGEPMAALSRLARNQNRFISLRENDSVILSSTPIPGNESAIFRVINSLCMNGAHVYRGPHDPVHVSGHGNKEDLKMLLNLVQPRFPIPYHGEARHAVSYIDLCEESGYDRDQIPWLQLGDVLTISEDGWSIDDQVTAGSVLVDGLTVGDVGTSVLRDRRHLADDGVIAVTVIIDKNNGVLLEGPTIAQRGFLHQPNADEFLDKASSAVQKRLKSARKTRGDAQGITHLIKDTLVGLCWKEMRRRPMILPTVLEM